jgi:adenylate cyclase
MTVEIERKFQVIGAFRHLACKQVSMVQGYLSSVPERSVRIRVLGDKGFITIKGIGNKSGTSRYEWEKEIALSEAKELLLICEPGMIEKTRYLIKHEKHTFEVDEFHGENQGLVIAEIELGSENEHFSKPAWLGGEVTGIPRYYNASLSKKPYCMW